MTKTLFFKSFKARSENILQGRGADILIMATSAAPFLTMNPAGEQFGMNPLSIYLITLGMIGVSCSTLQLRWGRRHIITRLLMIGGGISQSALVFGSPPPSVLHNPVPLTLLIAGTVNYLVLHAQNRASLKDQSLLENFIKLDLGKPFYVASLTGGNPDEKGIEQLAQRVQMQEKFYPLILHFPVKKFKPDSGANDYHYTRVSDEEKPDLTIVGCSLTGYDFLICGRYIDDSKKIPYTRSLMEKLSMINIHLRNGLKLKRIDILSLRMDAEIFTIAIDTRYPLSKQIHIETRKLWDNHIACMRNMEKSSTGMETGRSEIPPTLH